MKTRLTRSVRVAASFIRRGEVVAFPTETVYGLAADIFNEAAIAKVFEAKGRPADNPLIVHVASVEQIGLVAERVPPLAVRLIDAFFPGPLTIVLLRSNAVPPIASAGLATIAVRMPSLPIALDLIRESRTPLAAPSANLSGRPSPTSWKAVKADMDGRISCILCGEQTEVGIESTVVDCTGEFPSILRVGAVTLEQLRLIVPETMLANRDGLGAPKSPGLKHLHYSPKAQVKLVAPEAELVPAANAAFIGMTSAQGKNAFELLLLCSTVEEYAHSLFQFFRDCDEAGIKVIYCQTLPENGLGLAVMDRLRRASLGKEEPD